MKLHLPLPKIKHLQFLLPAFAAILIFSCSSPNQMISKGNYDEAIDVLIKKLDGHSSPEKSKQLAMAFNAANNKDIESIHELKSTGNPDIWYDVFRFYKQLEARQQKVAQLDSVLLQTAEIKFSNYDPDVEFTREKAAIYYYALSQKYLESGTAEKKAESLNLLKAIQDFYPGFRDVDVLLANFKASEPLYIYYHIQNDYPYTLPPGTANKLENIDFSKFDTPSYRFTNSKPSQDQFKIFVQLTLTRVKISPERTGELAYTESVQMQDGIAFELNDDGGFVLDSLGQKKQVPKFKTLVCFVTEFKQEKSMMLTGKIEVIDRDSEKTMATRSITGESDFKNIYAKFKGDMDALSPETFQLVGTKKLDFPADALMIMQAGDKLAKDAAKKVIEVLDNVEI
ncbi:MAG: hypothetical protein K9H16_08780 [Bacteroidales bacterium]|nr:hypothetical protein [Bacteroidales bacterium]